MGLRERCERLISRKILVLGILVLVYLWSLHAGAPDGAVIALAGAIGVVAGVAVGYQGHADVKEAIARAAPPVARPAPAPSPQVPRPASGRQPWER